MRVSVHTLRVLWCECTDWQAHDAMSALEMSAGLGYGAVAVRVSEGRLWLEPLDRRGDPVTFAPGVLFGDWLRVTRKERGSHG